MNKRRALPLAAGLALGAGVLLTARSAWMAPRAIALVHRRLDDIAQLEVLKRGHAAEFAAVAAFEKLPSKTPPPLPRLLKEAFPGGGVAARHREPQPLMDGWALRAAELTFDEMPLAEVGRFMGTAAEDRPPWTLVECRVTASGPAPGTGRATLVLEALEKTAGP
jgi:hypothetical protein